MDRLIYIAMTGAAQVLNQQAVTTHNLANASTTGFKAETATFRAVPIKGPGLPTRTYAVDATAGANLAAGTIQRTGRDLDVAIEGDGFLAVQALDGSEAYTRNGSLGIDAEGQLQTRAGLAVLGEGGPITIPPDSKVAIGRDGTVSASINGQSAANVSILGKIKLVNPAQGELARRADGLFRTVGGAPADADPAVVLVGGALEASNVNAIATMVDMITLARQYELHMKILQTAEQNAQKATQLLAASGQ